MLINRYHIICHNHHSIWFIQTNCKISAEKCDTILFSFTINFPDGQHIYTLEETKLDWICVQMPHWLSTWNLRSIEKKWWSAINRIDLWFQFLIEQTCSNFVDKNYSLGMLCFFVKHECVKIATPLADHGSSNSKKVKRKSNDSHLENAQPCPSPPFWIEGYVLSFLLATCTHSLQQASAKKKEDK
jgi:hypothetical protein